MVFCHQDFVVFESDWLARIAALPDTACYGPVGVSPAVGIVGRIKQTDGSFIGAPLDGVDVVGLDEQCLIVPRRLFSSIDFDVRFPFDLYVHDFCLAVRSAGFRVKTLQLDCQHRSKSLTGNVTGPRFLEAKNEYILKHGHQPPPPHHHLPVATEVLVRSPAGSESSNAIGSDTERKRSSRSWYRCRSHDQGPKGERLRCHRS